MLRAAGLHALMDRCLNIATLTRESVVCYAILYHTVSHYFTTFMSVELKFKIVKFSLYY